VYATIVTLVPQAGGSASPDGTIVQDAIWALAPTEAGLQHVRVVVRAGTVDAVLFCRAPTQAEAQNRALFLCQQACAIAPVLHGWQVSGLCAAPFLIEPELSRR